jgi:hypothetical protein
LFKIGRVINVELAKPKQETIKVDRKETSVRFIAIDFDCDYALKTFFNLTLF